MANTSNERRPRDEVMNEIHERVDMELLDRLTNTIQVYTKELLDCQIKTNVVCATIAYMLADALSQNSTHDDVCRLSETYGEYIHSCAHGLLLVDESDKNKITQVLSILTNLKKPN